MPLIRRGRPHRRGKKQNCWIVVKKYVSCPARDFFKPAQVEEGDRFMHMRRLH